VITGEGEDEAASQQLSGAEANFAVAQIAALVHEFGATKGAGALQAVWRKLRLLRQKKIGQSVRDLGVGEDSSTAFAS
jgi:hypothetical protein